MRKMVCTALAFLVLVVGVLPLSAQWMGGQGRHSGWWGGRMCRMMDVTAQPVDPASLPEPASLGAQLLKNQCTQCHGLVSPGQHAIQDWPVIVDRMDRRMQMMTHGRMGMVRNSIQALTSAEKQALLDYLQKHAFQAANPDALAKEQNPTVNSYIDICSRCHALPDPGAHTPQEWTAVVNRMEKNMNNMGMGPIVAEQKEEILTYLQKRTQ